MGKRFRFYPVHYRWMAKKILDGNSRYRVAKMFAERFGASFGSVKTQMKKHIPGDVPIGEALKSYLAGVRRPAEKQKARTNAIQDYWDTATTKQRADHISQMKEGQKRFFDSLTPEERKRWGQRRSGFWKRLTGKERSRIMSERMSKYWNGLDEKTKQRKIDDFLKNVAKNPPVRNRSSWLFYQSPPAIRAAFELGKLVPVQETNIEGLPEGIESRRVSRIAQEQRATAIFDALERLPNVQK